MPGKRLLLFAAGAMVVLLAMLCTYRYWPAGNPTGERERMLGLMPDDASTVVYVDLAELRASPVLFALLRWAPKPTIDSDYAQFLQATGFNYESDLARLALAIRREAHGAQAFVVADGRFDRRKIEAYASQYGSLKTADGKRDT